MPITDAHDRADPKPKTKTKPKVVVKTRPRVPAAPAPVPVARGRGGSTWEAEHQTKAEVESKRKAAALKAKLDRAERERQRLAALVPSATFATTPKPKPLTRQQELELSVDLFMRKNDAALRSVPNVRRAAAWLGPVGYGEAGLFDPKNPAHWALLGPNLAMMTPFGRPLKATAAVGAGAKAALKGGVKAAGPAATKYMQGRAGTLRASSWAAGKAADALDRTGAPKGLSDFVRNSPDSKRWFKNEDSMIWVDPAKSRTGRLAEKAWDKAVLPVAARLPSVKGKHLIKTERERWAQALEQQHHEAWKQAQRALVQIDAALGHGVVNRWFKKLSVPDFYALRMVGKNVDPDQFVARFRGLAEQARAAGDTPRATRLDYHAAMAEKAAPLVRVVGGDVLFSDLASRKLQTVYEYVERAGKFREDIYANLDLLSEANAAARKTNEELWHYGATYQQTDEFRRAALEASPNRKALYDIAKAKDPESAEATMEVIDAIALNWLERETTHVRQAVAQLRADVAAGSRDPQKAVDLKLLEKELKRGLDPDSFYQQWKETLADFSDDVRADYPDSVLMEIQPFHGFAQKKTAANLRLKLNPKNAGRGHPANKRIWRKVNGEKIVVAGDVRPEDWVKRVLVLMPDPEQRAQWANWYDEFEPMFRTIFGDDADRLMRGFAVSQANASPASGLRAVFKIMQALSEGKTVERGYGSVVAASIAKAVEGGEIDKGVAAKLSDFIDSLMRKDARTWMGDAAEGGRPVAVDVHAARDRGLIDPKMLRGAITSGRQSLGDRFGLVKDKDFVVDNNAGSPSGVMYERVAEWYEGLTDHLNAVGFDGRTDWEPRQVQALGWAAVQLLHGADPQDFAVALEANTRRVSFEVTQGMEGLGNDLSVAQAQAVALQLEPEMRRLVESTGAYLNGITHDMSMWAGGSNASVHMNVIGTDEQVDRILSLVAQAFDQHLVQATRIKNAGKDARAGLILSSDAFGDPVVRQQFGIRLRELVPALAQHGDMPSTYQNLPALQIITGRRAVGPKAVSGFLKPFREAVAQVEEEMGIQVRYGVRNNEIRIGDKVGRRDFNAGAGRAVELDDLDPVAREVREKLDSLLGTGRGRPDADGLASRAEASPTGGSAPGAREAERGRLLVAEREGYAEAADALRYGTVPADWLKRLVDDAENFSRYEKYRIGAHLDALVREGGGPSIIGQKFASVPGLEEFLTRTVVRGMYSPLAKAVVVGKYGGTPTILHELTHMQHLEGLFPPKFLDEVERFLKVGDDWTEEQMEELAALMEAVFLGFDSEISRLPASIKRPLAQVREAFLREKGDNPAFTRNAEAMLNRLDEAGEAGERVRDAAEHLMFYEGRPGYGFHGATPNFKGKAKVYMPETLGLPTSFGKGLYAMRAYASRLGGLVGAKSTILPGDKALSHEFTGHLLESGAFDRNVIKGSVYSQMKAARIYAMSVVQKEARKIGKAVPERADDIAIPADTRAFVGTQGKDIDFVAGMLHSIDEGKVISDAELSKVDLKAVEQARDVLFPGSSKATEADTQRLAEEILAGVREPIEGVVWVNRQDLLNTAVFAVPRRNAALRTVASVNDYLKALLLTMKPSYIPMNFVGNTAMGLMQQGAFAPVNYAKAWKLNHDLGDDAVLIDFFAGSGWMKSVFESQGNIPVLSKTLDKTAEFSGWLVDRHWRRAAFMYEARKMGYRTPDELRLLLKDPSFSDDLTVVSKRTKNAMVDFENLSQFEKEVMTNIVFVYPWFKGATYWAGRFVKDHPIQSAVYAYLVAQQQERLQDTLPDGYPGYLKWFVALGETERDGETYPYGMRLDQLLTFLTPADIANDLAAYATGKTLAGGEVEAGASYLNPLYEEFLATLTGYDSFTGQPVSKSWLDFFGRLLPSERSVAWKQIESIMDEGRRKKSMYHPSERDAWLKLFFGSLAPTPIDPEKAAERAAGHQPSAEARLNLWQMKVEKEMGGPVPPDILTWKQNEQKFNSLESEYKRENGIETGLSDQERAVVLLRLLSEIDGGSPPDEERLLEVDDETAEKIVADLRRELGLTQVAALDRDVSERRKKGRLDG